MRGCLKINTLRGTVKVKLKKLGLCSCLALLKKHAQNTGTAGLKKKKKNGECPSYFDSSLVSGTGASLGRYSHCCPRYCSRVLDLQTSD
ncbi:hypothetical protein F511_20246 [Dorcoceras hygrometricum]|uniref:Uncharacterized protein n=1 Tax=Dorcoceras hygrometricum TaxID=472368 RepID=A0A2Z7C7B8_9LAMI|nr:hypothetical protein F511_20246 [Dorcoceras hygrometricum]